MSPSNQSCIWPVPIPAGACHGCGTCRGEGVGDTLSIGNSTDGWPDCVQIWCVTRDPLDKCFTHVWGGVHLHVRTPLPYLANGWADCVQILCVTRDLLDKCFTHVWGGVHLHVRTCTPPSNDGASSPARPSPIKASYWYKFFEIRVKSVEDLRVLNHEQRNNNFSSPN